MMGGVKNNMPAGRRKESNEVRKYIVRMCRRHHMTSKEFRQTERCENMLAWMELRGVRYEDQTPNKYAVTDHRYKTTAGK